jgi:predicted NAD/FAD-binding protein
MLVPGKSGRLAVIGAGVAGLTAAYILQRKHHVTLFEKNDYAGGHTHTVTVDKGPDAGLPVDTGFIVMNHRNYPLLTRLLGQLNVQLQDSDMSFAYHDQASGLQYCGSSLGGVFAQRRNLVRPSFIRMLREILRFYKEASADLQSGMPGDLSLGDYLARGRYQDGFIRHHVIPMGAAIWSTPCDRMMAFPALRFFQFLDNHGLLSLGERPQWKTVQGGSHTYVKRMLAGFAGDVILNSPVRQVSRRPDGAVVTLPDGQSMSFDAVVIAAHADEALALLADVSDEEKSLLGAWAYQPNDTVLHTDASVMPPLRRAWASWNYTRETDAGEGGPATLSYHMNHLQRLAAAREYFVTLNRRQPYPAGSVIARMVYGHPVYTAAAMATQTRLAALNGVRNTYFCGSYFGYGFHEDAVRSGVAVAQAFGLDL